MGRRRVIGQITHYPALEAFRGYVEGRLTLDEFRKCDVSIKTEPIYAESPEPEDITPELFISGRALALLAAFVVGVVVGYACTLW